MTTEVTDFRALNDHDFLAERRRVREALEGSRAETHDRAQLRIRYNKMNAEFDRRARAAWAAASDS